MDSKYGQKFLGSTTKLVTDVFKTASKRVIGKTEEATGNLVENKIIKKVTMTASKD